MRDSRGHVGSQSSWCSQDRRAVGLIFFLLSAAILLVLQRERHFFLRDDFENYFLGGYVEIARALNAGELPLLTPLSWQAGALAGEFQFALFNPLLQALNLLLFGLDIPLPFIAAILVWAYGCILCTGTYVLARSKDVTPRLAVMAALVSAMNGWMILWGINWFPALSSFAWIPWTWWALERALTHRSRPGHLALAGLLIAQILTSGWPFTCLMTVLIATGLIAKVRCEKKPFRHALPVVWSGLLGAGLAAPAWLMLIEYSPATLRGQVTRSVIFQTEFLVPIKAYLGMILPTLSAPWSVPWSSALERSSFVMHVGLAPAAILVKAALSLRSELTRKLRYDLFFLVVLQLLASFPSLGMFRWSFRWLPLFFVQLALVAGRADRLLRRTSSHPRYGATALSLVVATSAYSLSFESNRTATNIWFCLGLVLACIVWWLAERSSHLTRWREHLPWFAVFTTTLLLVGVLFGEVRPRPRQYVAREKPLFDPEITYLAAYSRENYWAVPIKVYGQRFFPGNDHMYSNRRFVNGYSPMGPAGTTRLFGFDYIGALGTRISRELGPTLERMAVDGLVIWPETIQPEDFPLGEFERVASTPEFEVYHRRSGRTPRVQIVREARACSWVSKIWKLQRTSLPTLERTAQGEAEPLKFASAPLHIREDSRHRVVVEVDTSEADRPVLISFARAWYPGYRASVDGESTEVLRLDGLMPAVLLPAGRELEAVLEFRPRSFVAGVALSGLSLGVIVLVLGIEVRRRRRPPAPQERN